MLEVLLIALATIIASGIGTITGFGSSTILLPILLLMLPLPEAILLAGIIHLSGNIWKIVLFKKGFKWKLILLFGIPGIITTYLGARLTTSIEQDILLPILGVFLVLYVVFLFAKSSFKLPQSSIAAGIGGSLSGFLAGLFGVGGAVRGAFLTAFNLPKEVYIITAATIALFIDVTRITTYIFEGTSLDTKIIYSLIIFILATLVGSFTAKKIVNKIPQHYFRFVVAVFLFIIGCKFIFWS